MKHILRESTGSICQSYRRAVVTTFAILSSAGFLVATPARAQDAAKADAKHYKVELENDQVRVLRISYGPHEKGIRHSHPAGVAIFLTDANGKFTFPDGKTQEGNFKAGQVIWTDPVTHEGENVGDKPFELIQIELKKKHAGK